MGRPAGMSVGNLISSALFKPCKIHIKLILYEVDFI